MINFKEIAFLIAIVMISVNDKLRWYIIIFFFSNKGFIGFIAAYCYQKQATVLVSCSVDYHVQIWM